MRIQPTNSLRSLALAALLLGSACGTTTSGGGTGSPDASEDVSLSDGTIGDTNATDSQVADTQGGDSTISDTQISDTQTTDTQPSDVGDVSTADLPTKPDSAIPQDVNQNAPCSIGITGQCLKGQYCAVPAGQCSGEGKCAAIPEACDAMLAEVCGCNGVTYSNACSANVAGQNVAKSGKCEDKSCGGFVGKPCSKSQFCDPQGCGADMTGTCVDIPSGCPKNLAPVCGCDGTTYGNDCMRIVAGVAKAMDGNCGTPGSDCQTGDINTCAQDQYCATETAGVCSGAGKCTTKPQMCPMNFAPVCGCDAKTYSNACDAAANGQNVHATDACPEP